MNIIMQIQIVLFLISVIVCVAWTRMVYYDGLMQQIKRLRRHCVMHAAMISGVSFWAMSIGFNLHHSAIETINQQAETIQHLATGINKSSGVSNNGTGFAMAFGKTAESDVNESTSPTIDVTTPNGTSVSVSLDGRAEWSQLRRAAQQSPGGSGGIRYRQEGSGVRSDGAPEMPAGVGLHGAIY